MASRRSTARHPNPSDLRSDFFRLASHIACARCSAWWCSEREHLHAHQWRDLGAALGIMQAQLPVSDPGSLEYVAAHPDLLRVLSHHSQVALGLCGYGETLVTSTAVQALASSRDLYRARGALGLVSRGRFETLLDAAEAEHGGSLFGDDFLRPLRRRLDRGKRMLQLAWPSDGHTRPPDEMLRRVTQMVRASGLDAVSTVAALLLLHGLDRRRFDSILETVKAADRAGRASSYAAPPSATSKKPTNVVALRRRGGNKPPKIDP